MDRLYLFLLLLPVWGRAQPDTSNGGWACQAGKVRYLDRLTTNPKARVAYPGDATIDVTYYGLDLNLSYTPNYLRGVATIRLKSTGPTISSFFLDFNATTATTGTGLRVDSVTADGQRLTYRHAQNQLRITTPGPLAGGQTLTLRVYYQGVPNTTNGSFQFGRHENTTDPVIWTLSEPYGAPDWFPCKDNPADKVDSSAVRITAPAQFVSVSNGLLESTTVNSDGTRTDQWRNHYPIAQYLISIALTNYERYDTPFIYQGQTLPVTHYIYPEVLPQVRASLALTPQILALFSQRFGPYPFLTEKYGHAQFGQGNGGMEHQTISSMEVRALTPGVIAHELAHQWFGDKITCRDWQNIWLNEGFASYAEAVYAESANGPTGYQNTMTNFLARACSAQGTLYVQDISTSGNIFNGNRSYAKGASVLHMLRGVVGDSTFFKILRTYTATPTLAYGTAVTEDFQAVAQQVTGRDLTYFFNEWVYGEGYPIYRVAYAGAGTQATVRLIQRNSVTGSTNPTFFTMPVTIRVQSAAGDTSVTVLNDRADQTFTLPARGTVTGVVVDPANWLLKTVESVSADGDLPSINPPASADGLRVYPNPATETLTVNFTITQAGPLTLAVANLAGQRMQTLTESFLAPGTHDRTLSVLDLSAGYYVLTLETAAGRQSRAVLVQH